MGFNELLELEPRRFWFLNRQIDRLRAEEGMWQMRTNGSLTTPEAYEQTAEAYRSMFGEIYVFAPESQYIDLDLNPATPDPEFDRKAFLELKDRLRENR